MIQDIHMLDIFIKNLTLPMSHKFIEIPSVLLFVQLKYYISVLQHLKG